MLLGKLAHMLLVVEIVVDKLDLLLNRLVQLRLLIRINRSNSIINLYYWGSICNCKGCWLRDGWGC